MADPLFFVFIGLSVISFGIHSALIAHFARRFDSLVVATYRGMSLIVTMLPLLLFVPIEDAYAAGGQIVPLLFSAGIGSIAFVMSITGSRYLPIGVAGALRQTVIVPIAMLIGFVFLHEFLSVIQAMLLAGIGVCAILLTILRSSHDHLDPRFATRGIALSMIAGIGSALAWYFFSIGARAMHPFVAAYLVEVFVGLFTLLYLLIVRIARLHTASLYMPLPALRNIVLVAMFTISGTAGYALAVNHGSYPLASGLMVLSVIVATVLAWLLFKERLRARQVGLIVLAAFLMFLIKVVS